MQTVHYQGTLLAPSKLVCVGRNYIDHAKELGNQVPTEPVIFIKPNSAISEILTAGNNEPLHYEGELCFLVMENRLAAVGFGLDLTKRLTQQRLKTAGLPWERAKAFNGSAVLSEFIPLIAVNIDDLGVSLEINGTLVQRGDVSMMLFPPVQLLTDIAAFLSLEDGDIIMTGTPAGVGEFNRGDNFVGRVYDGNRLLLEKQWQAA